ncbi:hypothetical protein [Sphingomonas sp. IC4-52]|uniref:hypothetical protein n=1 Tax=Sphingomonas sp. IC4-52 TaxID=2887202 RepID=UPI001D10C5A8|nr:hypothetical protein [Sphingomonas sp. IC4-52]MCC2980799.1 hypothetical protein [Sphingomonas sp. IC4-52]
MADTNALALVGGVENAVTYTLAFDAQDRTGLGGARYRLVPRQHGAALGGADRWNFTSATPGLEWQLAEERPNPEMFGALGDGEADDTAALQAGLDYLAQAFGGGELLLAPRRYRVGALSLPKATGIVGSSGGFAPHYPATLNASIHTLLLNAGATVTMREASTMQGVVLRPYGMAFPQGSGEIARWRGTAITIAPESSGVHIGRGMIVGFSQAILAAGAGPIYRTRIEDMSIDCHNGISLSNVPDVAYLTRVHAWNFASTGRGERNDTARSGTAFYFGKRADWCKITDCFCFGYEIGFELEDVADCTLTGCGADHKARRPSEASSTGFKLHGRARNNRLIGCQAAAQGRGIHLATNPGEPQLTNHIQGGTVWDNAVGLEISAGHAMVSDLAMRVRGGVKIGAAAAGGRLSGLSFENIAMPQIVGDPVAMPRFNNDKPVLIG